MRNAEDIKPIEYLPPVMREVLEIQELYKGITPEIRLLFINGGLALDEYFINTAENTGLERMEAILGITPYPDDTVEDRRLRILAAMNGDTPYTFKTVYVKLKALCGEDNVRMSYAKDIYTLDVQIKLVAKRQFETVRDMLLRMIPCNISLNCTLVYNKHSLLSGYKHIELKPYKHRQLKEEVLN